MRSLAGLALVTSTLLMVACGDLLSLHALYTTEDQVFDAAVEGGWEDDEDRLLVRREGDRYNVILQNKRPPSDSATYEWPFG